MCKRIVKPTLFLLSSLLFLSILGLPVSSQENAIESAGRDGDIDGVRLWTLPDGPDGRVIPDQCWHAVGSAPDGDIYVAGMDHRTNSGLYRLFVAEDVLRYVGDARTASQAAENWLDGETAEKFHTRPTWHDGKMYVATTDKTDVGNGYLRTRGFHWYAFDTATEVFTDLSASEPDGVGAPHLQILTIAPDPNNNVLYGAANGSMEIVRYDVVTGLTENLGKPASFDQYIYGNRFMWVDSRGTLYFTAGNTSSTWHRGESKEVFNHVYVYDPESGFGERTDFSLVIPNAIEAGQWTRDRRHCYTMDDKGHIYRFDDEEASWALLSDPSGPGVKAWVFQLSADEKKIYIINTAKQLIEFDIDSGESRLLCSVRHLSSEANRQMHITGYDSWDNEGNFYVAAFSMYSGGNVILMRVDPVRLKVALGILPALDQVSADYSTGSEEIMIAHTGGLEGNLEILYQVEGLDDDGHVIEIVYGSVVLPAGSSSIAVPLDQLRFSSTEPVSRFRFSVVPDGNEYVTTAARTVEFAADPFFASGVILAAGASALVVVLAVIGYGIVKRRR